MSHYVFVQLLARLCIIAGIGFLAMDRAKTFKDETDESEVPLRVCGVAFIVVGVILYGVDWFWGW